MSNRFKLKNRVKQIYLEASYEIKLLALFFCKRIYPTVFGL